MKFIDNKKAQLELPDINWIAFFALVLFAWIGTIMGFAGAGMMEGGGYPMWMKITILLGELVACYIITAKMFD